MWKHLLWASLTGGLLALAWPTYGFASTIFFAFVPLLCLSHRFRIEGKKNRVLWTWSYWAFLIFNAVTTWWLYRATPFGMLFAVLVNSLLMSWVFLLYHILAKRMRFYHQQIVFICLWLCFEKFHLNWDFSWPWLNLGNAFSNNTDWIQWYEYTGTFGGSLWVLVVNCLLFNAFIKFQKKQRIEAYQSLFIVVLIVVIPAVCSFHILNKPELPTEKKINALLWQPNIDPYQEKYKIDNYEVVRRLTDDVKREMDSSTQYVIAPETVIPNHIAIEDFSYSYLYYHLKDFGQQQKIKWLLGATLTESHANKTQPNATGILYRNGKGRWFNVYNTACFIDEKGRLETYYKSKLVVGVEHIPYRKVIGKVMAKTLNLGGALFTLTPQKEREVFTNKEVKIAPVICYESVYGAFVTDYIKKGANILTVITNDGWWGNTEGHRQHLCLSKLRAIETRRYVLRSANTGISAVINTKGQILQQLGYDKKGMLKATAPLYDGMTFYVRYGDLIPKVALLVLLLTLPVLFLKRRGG